MITNFEILLYGAATIWIRLPLPQPGVLGVKKKPANPRYGEMGTALSRARFCCQNLMKSYVTELQNLMRVHFIGNMILHESMIRV